MSMSTEPIACQLTDAAQAQRLVDLRETLFAEVTAVEVAADGVGFSFAGTEERFRQVLDFVAFERACCPFLAFSVRCDPGDGPIQVRLGGTEEAGEFVRSAFLPLVPAHFRVPETKASPV